MIFDIIETRKDLFEADFIVKGEDTIIGTMSFKGKLASMEGRWNITFLGITIEMDHCSKNRIENVYSFRPYAFKSSNNKSGFAYQTRSKDGFFSRYDYHQIILADKTYSLYPIGMGKEGLKNPVFLENKQIALIEKDWIIYNDLHNFHILSENEESDFVSLLFCAYMFVNACYIPGEKVTESCEKYYSKTTNKKILSKYDASYKAKYLEKYGKGD